MSGRLRCWPGALARLTAYRWRDRFVEVVELGPTLGPERSVEPGRYWFVRPQGWNGGDDEVRTRADGCFLWPDHLMQPILPPPGTEVTTTDADKPVEVA